MLYPSQSNRFSVWAAHAHKLTHLAFQASRVVCLQLQLGQHVSCFAVLDNPLASNRQNHASNNDARQRHWPGNVVKCAIICVLEL